MKCDDGDSFHEMITPCRQLSWTGGGVGINQNDNNAQSSSQVETQILVITFCKN